MSLNRSVSVLHSEQSQLTESDEIFISDEVQLYIDIALKLICLPFLSLCGILFNIINIIVVIKIGLTDCVSMAVLFLAISDFLLSATTLFHVMAVVPMKVDPFATLDPTGLYFLSGWIREMFLDISLLLTAFVSLERCLCVTWPLKFKSVFTVKRSAVICTAIFSLSILSYVRVHVSHGIRWQFDVTTNRTRLMLWLAKDREEVLKFTNAFHRIFLYNVELASITLSAIFMAIRIRASARFRQQSTARGSPSKNKNTVSRKDSRVVTMVFLVAVASIVLLMPSVVFVYARRAFPDFFSYQRYPNMFSTVVNATFAFSSLNACVNIFVYYNFNTRYRQFMQQYACGQMGEKNTSTRIAGS
ncbi:proto-oncogene Mas-like [Aplysia californica]|uniref:Proto-oncogene Mas-like n=1 Tax=Aplysia californica TaxID=6500 RepID=A0ABM0JT28_APLCA|nr:proto-oncogene Mas-like [Aplysia californica]